MKEAQSMTDSRLQELKRTWEASGSVEDEAACLRERVRVGDLTQGRLELAAYCGHEGAGVALGSQAANLDFTAWVVGLESWGSIHAYRALVGCLHLCVVGLPRNTWAIDEIRSYVDFLRSEPDNTELVQAYADSFFQLTAWVDEEAEGTISVMVETLNYWQIRTTPQLHRVCESLLRVLPDQACRDLATREVFARECDKAMSDLHEGVDQS